MLAWLARTAVPHCKTGRLPANEKAQATWTSYWSDKGVDTSVMAKTPRARSWPFGAKLGGNGRVQTGYREVLSTHWREGVQAAAQDAANAAIDQ